MTTFLNIAPEKRLDYVYDLLERLRVLRELKALTARLDAVEAEIAKYKALLAKPVRETYRVYS